MAFSQGLRDLADLVIHLWHIAIDGVNRASVRQTWRCTPMTYGYGWETEDVRNRPGAIQPRPMAVNGRQRMSETDLALYTQDL